VWDITVPRPAFTLTMSSMRGDARQQVQRGKICQHPSHLHAPCGVVAAARRQRFCRTMLRLLPVIRCQTAAPVYGNMAPAPMLGYVMMAACRAREVHVPRELVLF